MATYADIIRQGSGSGAQTANHLANLIQSVKLRNAERSRATAMALAQQGDMSRLYQLDPNTAMALERQQMLKADREAKANQLARQAEAQAAKDRQQRTINAQKYLVGALQKAPDVVGPALERIRAMQERGAIDKFELPVGPDVAPTDRTDFIQRYSANLGVAGQLPEEKAAQPLSAIGKEVVDMFGVQPGTDEFRERRNELETMKRSIEDISRSSKDMRDASDSLRKEYYSKPTIKAHEFVETAWEKIKTSSDNSAGHLSLMFNYMKMIEPTSAVQQGEQDLLKNATGLADKYGIAHLWDRVSEGKILTDDQRNHFINEAEKLRRAQATKARALTDKYIFLAKERGLPVEQVVLPGSTERENLIQQRKQGRAEQFIDKKATEEAKLSESRIKELMAGGMSLDEAYKEVFGE